MLLLSVFLGLCRSHWSVLWFFLEVNTLRFCYILLLDLISKNVKDNSSFFYFLIQVFSSFMMIRIIFLFRRVYFSVIFILIIFFKMGGWPLHLWYIKVFNKLFLGFNSILFLSTIQKILPIFILSFFLFDLFNFYLFVFLSFWTILSSLVVLGGRDFFSLKRVIALSSLNSNGWMFFSLYSSLVLYSLFFLLYSFSLILVLLYSYSGGCKNTFNFGLNSFISIFLFSSLGGLPPLSIFWGKMIVVKMIILRSFPTEIVFFIVLGSCLILYFYMFMYLNDSITSFIKRGYSFFHGIFYYLSYSFLIVFISFLSLFSFFIL